MRDHGLPDEVLSMVRSHHERADGSGYPESLMLDQIHPYARIAAVADVYDAMTTERSYHEKMTPIKALTELSSNRHLYDANVLEILFRVVLHNEELVRRFLSGKIG